MKMKSIIIVCALSSIFFASCNQTGPQQKSLKDMNEEEVFAYLDSNKDVVQKWMELNPLSFEPKTAPEILTTADGWIKNFQKNWGKTFLTHSFLIKMDVLANHLKKLTDASGKPVSSTDVKYWHVFLAQKNMISNKLTLVIAPVFINGQNGYHAFGKYKMADGTEVPSVIEHAIPCPTCIDDMNTTNTTDDIKVPENINE